VQTTEKQTFNASSIGNDRDFERLFKSFYPRLCAYAVTMIHDRDEAEEIVQTLFCRLWEQRSSLDITISVQAYLFRAVRNATLNHIKKTQIRDAYKTMNLDTINNNPDYQPDRIAQSDITKRLENAISSLPEQCRLIFKMSRYEEMKYKEIADQLGISIKTVENQMGKALKILRGSMTEYLTVLLIMILLRL
jgi:RNA polymerase sigma-70 factor (family 1)